MGKLRRGRKMCRISGDGKQAPQWERGRDIVGGRAIHVEAKTANETKGMTVYFSNLSSNSTFLTTREETTSQALWTNTGRRRP
jgi:hypothetical protein